MPRTVGKCPCGWSMNRRMSRSTLPRYLHTLAYISSSRWNEFCAKQLVAGPWNLTVSLLTRFATVATDPIVEGVNTSIGSVKLRQKLTDVPPWCCVIVMAVFVRRSSAMPIRGKVAYFFKLSLQTQLSKGLAPPSPESSGSEAFLVEVPVRTGSEVYCWRVLSPSRGSFSCSISMRNDAIWEIASLFIDIRTRKVRCQIRLRSTSCQRRPGNLFWKHDSQYFWSWRFARFCEDSSPSLSLLPRPPLTLWPCFPMLGGWPLWRFWHWALCP